MSRFRKYPGGKPEEPRADGAFGKALQLARDLFDLDEDDPGIELVSELVPGAIWRFDLDGKVSVYREGYPGGERSLCYWFHSGSETLPGADNIIAAALLAVTDEFDFARRILQAQDYSELQTGNKLRTMIGLSDN